MISAFQRGSFSGFRLLWGLLLVWFTHTSVAVADPTWAGGPATTLQRFDFTTADEALAPDAAMNPLGVAAAVVEPVVPPGSGWQDPSGEFVTAGINGGDGAWDLGPEGWIEVTVPVSPVPPAGLSYDIEFHIEAIVYQGPVQRPGLTIAGHGIEGFQETAVLVEEDPPFGGYYRVAWTGTVAEAAAENLAFVVAATSFGALVDSIEIHTRYSLNKAPATVTLSNLERLYDGSPKAATVTTDPPGLTVITTYDGSPTAPTETGSYAVVATIDDPIYQGTASATLVIGKAAQTISFAPIADQLANASVNLAATGGASGNPVTFAVTAGPGVIGAGNVLTFTGAGNVTITASQADGANHLAAPDVPRTFAVSKAPATVALAGLAQTYDGGPKVITATTAPAGLDVVFSYDGAPAPPVNAGTYPVEGVIDDPIYSGTAAGSLVIAKASQSIDFPAIPDQVVSSVVNLSATGGASGNPVTFAVTAGPGSISGGNVLTFTTAGSITVTASQAGGPNHLAAMDVVRTFAVDFSGYDAWRDMEYPGETDPAVIGFSAAPFGQALPNGFRYYLGNGENDAAILTLSGQTGADWVYHHPRVEPARSDVGASYEWSTDLEHWQDGGESRGGVTVDFTTSAGAPDDSGIVSVEVRATPSGAPVDRLFVRLKLVFPFVAIP